MITIEKSVLKQKMLDTCITKQQSLIDDFNSRVKSLLESEGLGNEEEYDNNTLSQKNQKVYEINSLQEATNLATEEMNFLRFLKPSIETPRTMAEPGAVVVTNKGTYFVCVSIEQFKVNSDTYIGISTRSPLYLAMKGLKKGDKFPCKGESYKIMDIF